MCSSVDNQNVTFTALLCSAVTGWVSQGKRRFQQDGYDLDLSYVTSRVLGMGFPAKGREGALEMYNCGIVSHVIHSRAFRCDVWLTICL